MHPSLRLAVELPPVPAGARAGPASLEPWWQMALASVRAGAGVVWFSGGPTLDAAPGHLGCDASTIAAAAVPLVETALLGVVSVVAVDRHPAVLARDLTTLDILSGGRAAALLRWGGTAGPVEDRNLAVAPTASPAASSATAAAAATSAAAALAPSAAALGAVRRGLSGACEHLGEAVAVCRSVLQDDDPVFEGTHLHVAGAVNRPPPRRPGGPPLLVEVPVGAVGLARREAGPAFLLRQASSAAAAIVCADDPGEIASWRTLLDDAAASTWTAAVPDAGPAVVCRTTLRFDRTGRSSSRAQNRSPGRWTFRAPTSVPVRSRLDAARDAGAGGVIVRVPWGRRGDEAFCLGPGDAERISGDLADCFEPWRG